MHLKVDSFIGEKNGELPTENMVGFCANVLENSSLKIIEGY